MDYIDRIKKLKSEKKITNDRLSELTGIPLGTLSKILAGISDSPKLSNIVSIAEALGSSLDYIVSGIPQNHHNYTLTEEEIDLIEEYRGLDGFGRDLTRMVIAKEAERSQNVMDGGVVMGDNRAPKKKTSKEGATILTPKFGENVRTGVGKRSLLLYDLPVSAGPGVYLDDTVADEIQVPDTEKTQLADFALRICGNSM